MSKVWLTFECPNNSETIFAGMPFSKSLVAKVWRRVWKLHFSIPDLLSILWKLLRILLVLRIFPFLVQNTRILFDSFLWAFNTWNAVSDRGTFLMINSHCAKTKQQIMNLCIKSTADDVEKLQHLPLMSKCTFSCLDYKTMVIYS